MLELSSSPILLMEFTLLHKTLRDVSSIYAIREKLIPVLNNSNI